MSEFGERLFLHILTFSVPTSSSVFDLSYLTLHSYIQLICSNCAAIVLREPTAFVCKSNPYWPHTCEEDKERKEHDLKDSFVMLCPGRQHTLPEPVLCVAAPERAFFSPEPPRQKIGGQSQGRTKKLAWGLNTSMCFAGTLRAVLEGHSSPPRGPQRTIKRLFATWHLDGSLRAAVLFLTLSHLLCVMQAWCQALEQLPFSSSQACQSEEAHPHLFAAAAHGILMT